MKINKKLQLLVLLLICCITILGQAQTNTSTQDAQQIIAKKHLIADGIEGQTKQIEFAVVRVFIRYRTALWLWEDGKDETGRAEQFAVKAFEELYDKKNEIPDSNFFSLKRDILVLLETNAKNTAQILKTKYKTNSRDEIDIAKSLLNKKGNEKQAIEKLKNSLGNIDRLDLTTTLFIGKLKSQNSPAFLEILTEIVILEETGRSKISSDSLFQIVDYFRDANVTNNLRARFYRIVINKARKAMQPSDTNATDAYQLLYAIREDISKNAPELSAETAGLLTALAIKVPQSVYKEESAYKRIKESSDPLSTMISEAEATDDQSLKETLLTRAARLAKKQGKLQLAVDLVEKLKLERNPENYKRFPLWYDQFLGDVVKKALEKDDIDSAKYATKRIINKLKLAENLRNIAYYYFKKEDFLSANYTLDEAIRTTTKVEDGMQKTYSLIRLIPMTEKINKNRTSQVIQEAAKAINKIPSLDVDDKPGNESYETKAISAMATNWNLLPTMKWLAKENKDEAVYFASLIERKEIKVFADLVLAIDSLAIEEKNLEAENIKK